MTIKNVDFPEGIKVGDRVVHHFCGGSVYGVVIKVNRQSVRVKRDEDGLTVTYKISKLYPEAQFS